jgi:hypothetical protein
MSRVGQADLPVEISTQAGRIDPVLAPTGQWPLARRIVSFKFGNMLLE